MEGIEEEAAEILISFNTTCQQNKHTLEPQTNSNNNRTTQPIRLVESTRVWTIEGFTRKVNEDFYIYLHVGAIEDFFELEKFMYPLDDVGTIFENMYSFIYSVVYCYRNITGDLNRAISYWEARQVIQNTRLLDKVLYYEDTHRVTCVNYDEFAVMTGSLTVTEVVTVSIALVQIQARMFDPQRPLPPYNPHTSEWRNPELCIPNLDATRQHQQQHIHKEQSTVDSRRSQSLTMIQSQPSAQPVPPFLTRNHTYPNPSQHTSSSMPSASPCTLINDTATHAPPTLSPRNIRSNTIPQIHVSSQAPLLSPILPPIMQKVGVNQLDRPTAPSASPSPEPPVESSHASNKDPSRRGRPKIEKTLKLRMGKYKRSNNPKSYDELVTTFKLS
ncbi:hypothetical protein AKO1_015481 [Acrasis kona]|uniref:Uncharacterized protein n=1 Tax=Acrasis kona TaxID=1008807 RepID=A0AAW2ZFZ0_9EUKA